MQAVRGLLDNGRFTPHEAVAIPKRVEVTIMFHENTLINDDMDMMRRIAWLDFMEKAISESAEEDFPDIVRPKMAPPHGITD